MCGRATSDKIYYVNCRTYAHTIPAQTHGEIQPKGAPPSASGMASVRPAITHTHTRNTLKLYT